MVKGFKDDQGRFRPTDRTQPKISSHHDPTKIMGQDGVSISKQLLVSAGKFAKKRADEFKERQKQIKERNIRELELRRGAEKRIISSFKRARDLQIKDPVALKNQILIDVPEISDNRENLKFIENILNQFLKREKIKDKAIKKAKTDAQRIAIQEAFDRAESAEEKEVRSEIARVISRQEKELSKKKEKELTKLKEQKKESDKDVQELEKDIQDVIKSEVDLQEQETETEKKKEETEKKALEAEKREKVVTFADSVLSQAEERESSSIREGLKSDRFVAGEKADDALQELAKTQKETIEQQGKEDDVRDDAEQKRKDVEDALQKIEDTPIEIPPDTPFPLEIV